MMVLRLFTDSSTMRKKKVRCQCKYCVTQGKFTLVPCQLSNDGVYEPEQICPGVKPVEAPNLGVSTISVGQCHANDQMLDEDMTA